MFIQDLFRRRLAIAAIAAAAMLAPLAAAAQDLPSYAQPVSVSTDETIHGRIASVDGAFNISVNDDRGFVDRVALHQGTIINPTGLSLSPGMSVTIAGYADGPNFNANQIDTPYSYSGVLPTPVYYGAGYWCPGFAYGYGPSFSLVLVFGGGYHFAHHPYYGRPWNGHGYFGGYVGRPYAGVAYNGEHAGGPAYAQSRFAGEPHRAPSAFVGRSFAGEAYAGHSVPNRRRTTSPESRMLPTGAGHAASFPAAGFARSGEIRAAEPSGRGFMRPSAPAGGEFARPRSAGGGHQSSPRGGGFGRSASPGGHGGARH